MDQTLPAEVQGVVDNMKTLNVRVPFTKVDISIKTDFADQIDMVKNLPERKEGQSPLPERILLVISGCFISDSCNVLNAMIASGDLAKMIPAGYI